MARRRKRSNAPVLAAAAMLIVSVAALVGAIAYNSSDKGEVAAAVSQPQSQAAPIEQESEAPVEEEQPQISRVRFMAAGDNLIHDNIYKQAASRAGGNGFDFSPAYEHIEHLFDAADLSFINQETIIAEKLFELSGFPTFNSPEAVGDKVVEMGFDIVCMANNHMLDKGESGLIAAMDYWDSKREDGVLPIGVWRNEQAMTEPLIYEKNGIRFGFVPMTEHTNGLHLPADSELRYINTDEYDLMEQQIKLARESCDFLIVSTHWGTENSVNVNDNQLYLAQWFSDLGVDLVLGHHSHTLQPMEWRTGKSGNRTLVVYSLGNFISSMLNPQNMLGGVLDLEITMQSGEKPVIESAEMIPIVTHYDTNYRREVRVYPFSEYTEELISEHGISSKYINALYSSYGMSSSGIIFSLDYLQGIIDKNIPKEFLS